MPVHATVVEYLPNNKLRQLGIVFSSVVELGHQLMVRVDFECEVVHVIELSTILSY